MSRFAAGKNGKPGKVGGPILLPDYTPITKAERLLAEKFNATAKEHDLEPIEIRGPVPGGKITRRVARRQKHKLTAVDVANYIDAQRRAPAGVPVAASSGKRVQKYQRSVMKAVRTARLTVGLLIRSAGLSAPLVAQGSKLDPYKQSIAQRGTSISPPEAEKFVPNPIKPEVRSVAR
jgi:hypothetical protein